jgi:hypothetical protein
MGEQVREIYFVLKKRRGMENEYLEFSLQQIHWTALVGSPQWYPAIGSPINI